MAPEGGGSLELMEKFLKLICCVLKSRKNFEAAQAYLGLFLKLHSETLIENMSLIHLIEEIQTQEVNLFNNWAKFGIDFIFL